MKFLKNPFFILFLTMIVLVPLTTFNVLDTFFFTHTSGKISTIEDFDFNNPTSDVEETTVEYTTGSYEVTPNHFATYHLLDIKLKKLTNLRCRLARDEDNNYGVNIKQKMKDMVKDSYEETQKDVLGAITGDFPFWSTSRSGFVVRNGVVYRDERRSKYTVDLVIEKNGSVGFVKEGDYELDAKVGEVSSTFYQIIAFGPVLLENGEIKVKEDEEINGNTWVNNQRAAIGFVDRSHLMFLATDSEERKSTDLNSFRLYDLASFLKQKGCGYAYNFDGGYTSGLAYNNEVVFAPGRAIGDMFYVISD